MAILPDGAANDTPVVDIIDERLSRQSAWRRFLARPDLGAFAGVVLVFAFFGVTAGGTGMFASDGVLNWLTVTAQLMIIGTGAALLMIGGEFDLSVGSMIGFVGMMIAIPTIYFGVPIGASVIMAFVAAMAIGALNGFIIVRTRLPSFIVTLASLYMLRGLTIALSILVTNRTTVSGLKEYSNGSFVAQLFSAKLFPGFFQWLADNGMINKLPNGEPVVSGVPMLIIWALVMAVVGHIVLTKTRVGNWIFASGGDANAARNVGVPVARRAPRRLRRQHWLRPACAHAHRQCAARRIATRARRCRTRRNRTAARRRRRPADHRAQGRGARRAAIRAFAAR